MLVHDRPLVHWDEDRAVNAGNSRANLIVAYNATFWNTHSLAIDDVWANDRTYNTSLRHADRLAIDHSQRIIGLEGHRCNKWGDCKGSKH
jgi:hypothetical protein